MANKSEHITRFFKCHDAPDERHHLLDQKLIQLRKLDKRLVELREEFCYNVASTKPLTREERKQILWLIEPNTNDHYVTVSDNDSHLRSRQQQPQKSSGGGVGSSPHESTDRLLFEVGPRLSFCSPFSTNAVSILRSSCPQTSVYRLERSIIYELSFNAKLNKQQLEEQGLIDRFVNLLHDQMVETIYETPVESFNPTAPRVKIANGEDWLQPCAEVAILERGADALREVSSKLGLFFDDWDINYYVNLFRDSIKRNPTIVECFDLAQSNSEHSRHWFFKGILDIRGRKPSTKSLIDMVGSTQLTSNQNNIIKFEDNSSAIVGFQNLSLLRPQETDKSSPVQVISGQHRHIIFTAETHNFPTGVAPFPGAATGTGGRIRDVQATGRGAHVIAGTAGYSFGNLLLDNHELDWENPHELYPNNLAHPSRIAIEASNGASDYGNKFGEPIIAGFARSFGMRLVSPKTKATERWEYLKPIMFTGGIGSIEDGHTKKVAPAVGMQIAKIGGPIYRIGIGGGAASSNAAVESGEEQRKKTAELNFNAVQRGDPEMEQKLNRVIRACIENNSQPMVATTTSGKSTKGGNLGSPVPQEFNPILSIHDQGAGGNGNVLKEIVDPLGTTIDANKFTLGDHTVNVLELWAAEYQESDAVLAHNTPQCKQFLERVSRREKCQIDVVGQVEDSGQIRLKNFASPEGAGEKEFPIDLKLEYVIGSMPRKVFQLEDYARDEFLAPAKLIETDEEEPPKSLKSRYKLMRKNQQASGGGSIGGYPVVSTQSQIMSNFEHLLRKVLQLPSVASKRYLTTKVDRCVTGLIAGQQCLGPLHTPIGDYALIALTHFDLRGSVTAIGEQPIKGLVSPVSNAQMSVAEALTNMMFCCISSLKDVKCSANWMWAAKLPGEGAKLLDACEAMCKLMASLGIAVDGGKDSLSMSATVDPAQSRKLLSQAAKQSAGLVVTAEDGDNETATEEDEDDVVEVVKSPGTLVISAYAPVPDIRCKVTPILCCKPKRSHLIYVNLAHPIDCELPPERPSGNKFRLGGSAILQTLGQVGDEAPTIDFPELLRDGFELVQELIREQICTAGHDISDGGLIVCALEMAIASHCGIHLSIQAEKAFSDLSCANNNERVLAALFAEECGIVIEVEAATESELNDVLARFEAKQIHAQRIGFGSYENQRITVKFEQQLLLEHANNYKIREFWESTSRQLEFKQANRRCVMEEYDNMSFRAGKPNWLLTFDANATKVLGVAGTELTFDQHFLSEQPKVAVLREEGINGDREMIASLTMAGFQVFDVTVTDLHSIGHQQQLQQKKINLNAFQGIVFPGGFSYADVFGSGRGWAASLIFDPQIRNQLIEFRRRPNTFSLGVCNGCQLMSLLGFLDDLPPLTNSNRLPEEVPSTSVRLEHNNSGRFECRFVSVRIETTTNSIMLRDMEDSTLGVWVAHGEGKFKIEQSVEVDASETRIALRYVDDKNEPTQEYPMNPNGSDQAVAGLCSRDGRHLAMMPHPERCTQLWQWPHLPQEWQFGPQKLEKSPWMKMFTNAYDFCRN